MNDVLEYAISMAKIKTKLHELHIEKWKLKQQYLESRRKSE